MGVFFKGGKKNVKWRVRNEIVKLFLMVINTNCVLGVRRW